MVKVSFMPKASNDDKEQSKISNNTAAVDTNTNMNMVKNEMSPLLVPSPRASVNTTKSNIVNKAPPSPPPPPPHHTRTTLSKPIPSRKAMSNFLRSTKSALEEDFAGHRGRVSVYLIWDELPLNVVRSGELLNSLRGRSKNSSSSSSDNKEDVNVTKIESEWEIDDRYYDVVRLWQKPYLLVPGISNKVTLQSKNGKVITPIQFEEEELKSELIALEDPLGNFDDMSEDLAEDVVASRSIESLLVEADSPEVYIFNFGAIVFWNFTDSHEEKEWIKDYLNPLERRFGDIINKDAATTAEDELVFTYNVDNELFDIRRDRVKLSTREPGEKMAVSYGLAKSSLMSVYEWKLEQTIDRNTHIPHDLATTGKINMKKSEINKEIGRIFLVKHEINLDSNLQDIPDEFWEDDRFEPVYNKVLNYFELKNRLSLVNNRLLMIQDLHKVMMEAIESNHSAFLEWIVIILILVEILFEIFDLFLTGSVPFMR